MSHADTIPLPAALWRRLSALGIDPVALVREARLRPSLLGESRPRVTTADFFALWHALERLDPDPMFAFRLVQEASLDQFDVASIAAMHSPTFRDALAKLARYKRLVCPEDVIVRSTSRDVVVTFRWYLSCDAPPARLIDACLASVLHLGRKGTGTVVQPKRVDLARPAAHADLLQAQFGCPVEFGARANRLILDSAVLDLPFQTSNPDLLAVLLPGMESELASRSIAGGEPHCLDAVKREVRAQMQGRRPSVRDVARALAISARGLQRRLQASGTSYQSLLDEVRSTVACELLSKTSLDSGEIAFLLGFEELNSFNRAFSAWHGTTPLRWRNRALPAIDLRQRRGRNGRAGLASN